MLLLFALRLSLTHRVLHSDQKTIKSFDSLTALISGVSKGAWLHVSLVFHVLTPPFAEFNLRTACPQKGAESNYL
jgi:hypothetical protein